jgi:hypothetical protein
MEAAASSETLVTAYQTAWSHKPEGGNRVMNRLSEYCYSIKL